MKYQKRALESQILRAKAHFSAILVTGPRRSGKTTLLRHMFPQAQHVLFEDSDVVARVRADPRSFLDALSFPVILDEIQHVPELFPYIRTRIDTDPEKKGQWLITGSQEAPLMQGVTESMAGRAAIFTLLPFSFEETDDMSILTGGFPEVVEAPEVSDIWFRSYIQTYLERDVRAITSIKDLSVFRRFIGLLASRCGQMLNKTDIAAPLGVSVPTITQWLSILEITGQIILVSPFFENFGKRIVKSHKLYFIDSGLTANILGIRDEEMLQTSPFRGALFESLVASEILKIRLNHGLERGLYYFRDRQGLEVDFIVDQGNGELLLIEVKASNTPMPDDARSILKLSKVMSRYTHSSYVVYVSELNAGAVQPLRPGVKMIGVNALSTLFTSNEYNRII